MSTTSWRVFFLALVVALNFAFPTAFAKSNDVPMLVVAAKESPLDVVIDLPKNFEPGSSSHWQLVEQGDSDLAVPVDVIAAVKPDGTTDAKRLRLIASIPPREGAKGPRRFALKPLDENTSSKSMFQLAENSPTSIQLLEGDRPVFVYNYGQITNETVPKKDRRRTRGCYVHPIYGLDGEVLTDDFPRDHYHHHGLFWSWPHVQIGEKKYDLWTGRGIRQKFVRWLDRTTGEQGATIGVENGWYVGKRKVMTERVWLTAHKATDSAQAIDVALTFIPVDRPVTLWGAERKSYGGATIRFDVPKKKKGLITVPTGESKRDLAMKRLAWADLSYPFGGKDAKPSGATLMVSKTHPDYPPTWLTRHYGPLCIGYPGVVQKTFEPDKPLTLRYRLWIHKGQPKIDLLKKTYDAYTSGEDSRWE